MVSIWDYLEDYNSNWDSNRELYFVLLKRKKQKQANLSMPCALLTLCPAQSKKDQLVLNIACRG